MLWFNSVIPHERTRALEWDAGDGNLYWRERERDTDMWPAPDLIAENAELGVAEDVASARGLTLEKG